MRGEKGKKVQHPGFARLPLLLLPEGERVKRDEGHASMRGEKKKKKKKKERKKEKLQHPGFARPPGPHY